MLWDVLDNRWIVVQVRPRAEQTVSRALEEKGYECLVLLCRERNRLTGRFNESETPLFPGYVFCRFRANNLGLVGSTPGVIRILGQGRTPEPVADDEIAALREVHHSGLAREPWPMVADGQAVEVVAGPLRGVSGVVVSIADVHRLIVSVTLLQRSVAVEIEREWILTPVLA